MSTLFEEIEDEAPAREPLDLAPFWKGSALAWGAAVTQGSKKGFIVKKRVVIVDDNDRALKSWRQELIKAMRRVRPEHPLDRPVAMSILIYVSRPMAHFRKDGELKPTAPILPGSGKDVDKVCRAIFDAGEIAGWYCNDARVVDLRIRRRFHSGEGERVWVWAWAIDRADQPQPELFEEEPEATAESDPIAPPKRRSVREDFVEPDVRY